VIGFFRHFSSCGPLIDLPGGVKAAATISNLVETMEPIDFYMREIDYADESPIGEIYDCLPRELKGVLVHSLHEIFRGHPEKIQSDSAKIKIAQIKK
jgi:hypothetical protein